jgi:hypothetical protein
MFGDLAINLAASVIYDFGKKIHSVANKTEWVQLTRKQLGISATLHDFPDRYLEALVELRFEDKTKVVLDFFRSEDIMQTFFDFYYGAADKRNNESLHTSALNRHIEALQVGDDIKSANVDVAHEVDYFWRVFRQKVHESRTVKEVELQQEIDQLKATTNDTNELAKKVLSLIEQKGDEPMQAHLKQWAEKIYNIQHAGTVNFHIYGDKKIPTILTAPTASVPTTFLGRETELQDIRQLLNSNNTLALVNSEGGMGKTTIAAAYWNLYHDQYKYLAWLFCENGILSAMRSQLPQPLGLQEAMNAYADSPENQHAFLKNNLANLDKDCLLVLDNATDEQEIKAFLTAMNGLGWHVLMTSRCTKVLPNSTNEYPITSLPPDLAKQLFKENYTETSPDFEALLDRFLKAVGYNTLCIEIFSKNLREGGPWGYTFADFLRQLEEGGLFLGDNSFDISTDYTGNVRKPAQSSDEIIRALYDFADLATEATDLLIRFSLLPAENHTPDVLWALLPNDNKQALKRQLDNLAQKGWLATDTKTYRVSPPSPHPKPASIARITACISLVSNR